MKKTLALVAMIGLGALVTGCESTPTAAAAPADKPAAGMLNSTCPYSGQKADASVTSEMGAHKIAFCCAKCKGKFDGSDDKAKHEAFSKAFHPTAK